MKHPTFVKTMLSNPLRGAEIGVERGHFTEQMLATFPALHMYTVDPWQVQPAKNYEGWATYADWPIEEIMAEFSQRIAPYAGRVTVLRMESVVAAEAVDDGSLDFAFIDAEHTYENVMEDIAAWRPKVKAGGLLMGHDFSPKYPGVSKAVNEVLPQAGVDAFSTVWWAKC